MNPATVSEHLPEESAPAHGHDHTLIGWRLFTGVLVTLLLLGIGFIPAINHHGTGVGLALCAIMAYWIAFGVRKLRRVDLMGGEPPVVVRFWDGLYAALLTTLLVSLLFHLTPLAAHGEQLAFEAFHSRRSVSQDFRPRVTVIDISQLDREPVTDRRKLSELLRRLVLNAPTDALPAAIGIDVNFHKPGGGLLNPKVEEEARFLELCLEADAKLATRAGAGTLPETVGQVAPLRDAARSELPEADAATRVPPHREKSEEPGEEQPLRVLLGVSRALSDPAETWIALPRYTRLAASIDVPEEVYARSYARFHIPGQPELRGMGLALAEAYGGEIHAKHPLWGTELFGEETLVKQTEGELHCLDFGRLDSLRRHVLSYGQVMRGAFDTDAVRNRILLLGDVRDAKIEDAFTIPGRTRPLPGVLLHALSAETLVQGPLFEFKPAVNLALEAGFEIFAMFCLIVVPAIYGRRLRQAESLGALVRLFTILFVVAALSLWVLGALQILWLEAFSVAVGLALSPYVEAALVGVVSALRGHAAAVTEPEGAAHE